MEFNELKEAIGASAEHIIASQLKLKKEGGTYPCCITKHKKGNSARMTWFEDGDTVTNSFFCFDCNEKYDIITHAMKYHSDDVKGYLDKLVKGKTTKVAKEPKKVQVISDFTKIKEIDSLSTELHDESYSWLESRGISLETAETYGITGTDTECHFNYYIPTLNKDEFDYKLVFLKARKLGTIENGKDKYRCQKGGTPVLFGMHTYTDQKILMVQEGEVDCLSMYEGVRYNGYEDKICCVSVPNGTSHAWIQSCKSFIEKFEMVVILSDADSAGVKFREGCFEKLSYCKDVRWIDIAQVLPKGKKFNDVNDYLRLHGKGKVADLLNRIEVPHHSCGVNGEKIERGDSKGYVKTGFFGLDRALGGLPLGGLSLLAGESNDGKSTIGRQIIGFVAKEHGIGVMMGEETDETFMDLMIRQQYHEKGLYDRKLDEWGDKVWTPKVEVEDRWRNDFGKKINLFQMGRVRENENMLNKLCEWIAHCADIEGRKFFFIDNIMKITADNAGDEFAEQGHIIEKLYRLVLKKNIHIMLVAHTRKVDGLLNDNSISGSKKLVNTPDIVIAFQRIDRLKSTKDLSKEGAKITVAYNAGLIGKPTKDDMKEEYAGPDYTSFFNAFKIRKRKSSYTKTVHCLKYDLDTQLSYEQLPSATTNKDMLYEDGYSKVLPTKPTI